MKKLYMVALLLMLNITSLKAEEIKCETTAEKVNPACSKILKGVGSKVSGIFGGLKKFSAKHKTIGQTVGIEKKEKSFNLKEFSKKNKTVNDTINNVNKKK
jgi:NADPH-dependent curcumin reductase CurA